MKRFFAIILLLGASLCHAQVDTVFWFALPAVSSPQGTTHRLTFQSYDTAATIIVEKIYSSVPTFDTLSMGVQQHHRHLLDDPGSYTANSPQYRGIHIRSTASVSCVYDIFVDTLLTRGERYCLKGRNALGTHFAVPAPIAIIDHYEVHNSIEMIATEDSTMAIIDIPTRYPRGDHPRFWTHDTVFLQRGESYIVRNDTTSYVTGGYCVGELNGTIVRTTKPVALNSSDAGNYNFYEDMPSPSGDQLIPAHLCGTNTILKKMGIHSDDPYAMIGRDSVTCTFSALYDNTTILYYGGSIGMHTINRGERWEVYDYPSSSGGRYTGTSFGVWSDKPIAIIEVLTHNHRMSYTMPPPLECTGSQQIAAYSAIDVDSTFNYTVLGPTHIQTHGLINGNTLPSNGIRYPWHIPLNGYALHDAITSDTIERTLATIDSGSLHLYTWNRGEFDRFYTCHSEYAAHSYLTFDMGFTEFESGDSIHFRYAYRNVTNLHFTGPNCDIRVPTPGDSIIILTDARSTGWYYLQGRSVGGCHDTLLDSVYIFVRPANNEVYDTVEYQLCRNQLPFTINGCTFDTAGSCNQRYAGSHDCDSIVTYIVTLLPDSDTTLYDTIDGLHLPWSYRDSTFSRPVSNFLFVDQNILGCDSVIHYNLHIIWRDTIYYYICPSQLPFTIPIDHGPHSAIEPLIFYDEGTQNVTISDGNGTDSLLTYIVSIIPNSEAHIYDTIVESQLPWFAFDTLFNDTINDYIYTTYNEAGCDSTIHYSLYIYWDGDHCDTSLIFGNVVTPNGDGVNDRFTIGGLIENNCFKYNELTIYDRSGRQVYHRKNISREEDWWDPASERIPAGTYFFIFKAHGVNIYTQHQGVIEVLRM